MAEKAWTRFLTLPPRRILAVRLTDREIESCRARRVGREWKLDPAVKASVPPGADLFEVLRAQGFGPDPKGSTGLIVYVGLTRYTLHREFYPRALEKDLDKALAFDWGENSLLEEGKTVSFSGEPVVVEDYVAAPIFSVKADFLDKLKAAVNAQAFKTFTLAPSAEAFRYLISGNGLGQEELAAVGVSLDENLTEIHLFNQGRLLESSLVRRGSVTPGLLRIKLQNAACCEFPAAAVANGGDGEDGQGLICETAPVKVRLFCRPTDCELDDAEAGLGAEYLADRQVLEEPLIALWTRNGLRQGLIRGIGDTLRLAPFKLPREVAACLALLAIFALYAGFTVWRHESLVDEAAMARRERGLVEAKLKPVEKLQERVEALKAGDKLREAFQEKGYPGLDLVRVLTEQTPDDAWYNYLSLKDDQLILQGEATSTVKLIQILSKLEGFEDVRLTSPVRNNPATNKERFSLQIKINAAALKKMLKAKHG